MALFWRIIRLSVYSRTVQPISRSRTPLRYGRCTLDYATQSDPQVIAAMERELHSGGATILWYERQ